MGGTNEEGVLHDSVAVFNEHPIAPQEAIGFVEPSALANTSSDFRTTICGSLSITEFFDFADPCRPFSLQVTSRPLICESWDAISRNLIIAATLAGECGAPAVSLRASTAFNVLPTADGVRVSIDPGYWSDATSFTIVGLYLSGQVVDTPLLPATVTVVPVNHAPSQVGRLWRSAIAGSTAGVISAIKGGRSTEERYKNNLRWGPKGMTALFEAAASGRGEVVSVLIAAGASLDDCDEVWFISRCMHISAQNV